LLWAEADASKVIYSAGKLLSVCVQEVYGCLDAVIDVDHRKEGLGLKEALVFSVLEGLKEDFYCE
jgi:hypothetical protein